MGKRKEGEEGTKFATANEGEERWTGGRRSSGGEREMDGELQPACSTHSVQRRRQSSVCVKQGERAFAAPSNPEWLPVCACERREKSRDEGRSRGGELLPLSSLRVPLF